MAHSNINARRDYVRNLLNTNPDMLQTRRQRQEVATRFGCSISAIDSDVYYLQRVVTSAVIYALVDPRTDAVRYVGRTIELKRRLVGHRNDHVNPRKREWIVELRAVGLQPAIIVLEECHVRCAVDREDWWINEMRRRGADLTNAIEAN